MVSKEPQPVQAWLDASGRVHHSTRKRMATAGNGTAGGSLHHEKPPRRCGTRRNSYETGARGLQRDIVQVS